MCLCATRHKGAFFQMQRTTILSSFLEIGPVFIAVNWWSACAFHWGNALYSTGHSRYINACPLKANKTHLPHFRVSVSTFIKSWRNWKYSCSSHTETCSSYRDEEEDAATMIWPIYLLKTVYKTEKFYWVTRTVTIGENNCTNLYCYIILRFRNRRSRWKENTAGVPCFLITENI